MNQEECQFSGQSRKYDMKLSISPKQCALLENVIRTHRFRGLTMEEYDTVSMDANRVMGQLSRGRKEESPVLELAMEECLLLANMLREYRFEGLTLEEYGVVIDDAKRVMVQLSLVLQEKKPEIDRLMARAQSGLK